ncbi:MAG: hypothetical protein HC821_03545 [Lewinella sp.]|nr:hypothetical protein [Lewinella sp.]
MYFFFGLVQVIRLLNRQDYNEAIKLCWFYSEKLSKKSYSPRSYIRAFLIQIVTATLRYENFDEGKRAIQEYLKIVDEGDTPWFRIHLYYVYLCLQSEQFKLAINTLNTILGHSKFRRLPAIDRERWLILRAYIYWLTTTGLVKTDNEKLKVFRVNKFANEMTQFNRDRQGMNITILVIQVLFLMQQKRYEDARQKIQSLSYQVTQQLRRTAGLERTYYFACIVLQLSKANFNRIAFERKAARYLQSLASFPRSNDPQAFEVEVIRYDLLYHYIYQSLGNSLH